MMGETRSCFPPAPFTARETHQLKTIEEAGRELPRGAADIEPEVDRQRPRDRHAETAREVVVRVPPVEHRGDARRVRRGRGWGRGGPGVFCREGRRGAARPPPGGAWEQTRPN